MKIYYYLNRKYLDCSNSNGNQSNAIVFNGKLQWKKTFSRHHRIIIIKKKIDPNDSQLRPRNGLDKFFCNESLKYHFYGAKQMKFKFQQINLFRRLETTVRNVGPLLHCEHVIECFHSYLCGYHEIFL